MPIEGSSDGTNTNFAASSIQDTTSWTEPRNLDKLPDFLEKFTKEPDSLGRAAKLKESGIVGESEVLVKKRSADSFRDTVSHEGCVRRIWLPSLSGCSR